MSCRMNTIRTISLGKAAVFGLILCVAAGSTAAQNGAASLPDVSGLWVFHERVWVLQPSELNPVIGAPPATTPMTQVVCDSVGSIEFAQQGAELTGTATQSVVCEVDGVEFVPPDFAFNPVFEINGGWINGRSIYFETGHTANVCDNRGSIRIHDGIAERIDAVGDCPVPFHPGEQHAFWTIWRP